MASINGQTGSVNVAGIEVPDAGDVSSATQFRAIIQNLLNNDATLDSKYHVIVVQAGGGLSILTETDGSKSLYISAGGVSTAKIADDAVTQAKVGSGAIGTTELASDAVTAAKIANNAVGSSEIATGAVGSDELASNAVTQVKVADDAIGVSELDASGASSGDVLTATSSSAMEWQAPAEAQSITWNPSGVSGAHAARIGNLVFYSGHLDFTSTSDWHRVTLSLPYGSSITAGQFGVATSGLGGGTYVMYNGSIQTTTSGLLLQVHTIASGNRIFAYFSGWYWAG